MTEQIWLDIAYPCEFRERSNSHSRYAYVVERFPFELPVVEASDAPIAFSLKSGGEEINWRIIDGRLMRDVCLSGLTAPLTVEASQNLAINTLHMVKRPMGAAWNDHPFLLDRRFCSDPDFEWTVYTRNELLNREHNPRVGVRAFSKFVKDGREQGLIDAQMKAADLVVVDGRVMKPAEPPLLAVTVRFEGGSLTGVEINPHVAGADESPMAMAFFRVDEHREAYACAERVAALLSANELEFFESRAAIPNPVPVLDLTGDLTDYGLSDAPSDPRLEALQTFSEYAFNYMRIDEMWKLDFQMVASYALARRAIEQHRLGSDELIEPAMKAIIENVEKLGTRHRYASRHCYMAQEAERARGLLVDAEIDQEDEAAFRF